LARNASVPSFAIAACATVAYADKPTDGSWRRGAISLVGPEELAADLEAIQERATRKSINDVFESDFWLASFQEPAIRDVFTSDFRNL
jgi:hypothetical protein